MTRSLMIAAALGLSLAASNAEARGRFIVVNNGTSLNGASLNGLSFNGVSSNGANLNGVVLNGRLDRSAGPSGARVDSITLPDGSTLKAH